MPGVRHGGVRTRLARGAEVCMVLPRCGDSSTERQFPAHHVYCGHDRRVIGVESFSPHGNDLDAALMAYLAQHVDDNTDWDRAATELDRQLAEALSRGDELDRKMAAAIRPLKNRVHQRRASVRGKN